MAYNLVAFEGHDGPGIIIETHKHAPDEDALERLRVSLVPDPDGTVRNLNGFGVINSTQSAGREYAERYVRLGLRMGF